MCVCVCVWVCECASVCEYVCVCVFQYFIVEYDRKLPLSSQMIPQPSEDRLHDGGRPAPLVPLHREVGLYTLPDGFRP